MNKYLLKIVSVLAMTLLTGCASMNGQFDCPAGTGVSCKSMKDIDKMVSQGHFAEEGPVGKVSKWRKGATFQSNTLAMHAPFRVKENIMKVWFAPFVDSDDNYHDANEIYTVINKSAWQGNPISSIEGASS